MTVEGVPQVWDNLNKLTAVIRDKLLRKAGSAAMTPVFESAKQIVAADATDTGTLGASLAVKITSRGNKGSEIHLYMGPKTKIRVPKRIVTRGKHKGLVMIAIPTRYAHLIEFGHDLKDQKGNVVGHIGPVGFMRRSWDTFGGDKALTTFVLVLQQGITEATAQIVP